MVLWLKYTRKVLTTPRSLVCSRYKCTLHTCPVTLDTNVHFIRVLWLWIQMLAWIHLNMVWRRKLTGSTHPLLGTACRRRCAPGGWSYSSSPSSSDCPPACRLPAGPPAPPGHTACPSARPRAQGTGTRLWLPTGGRGSNMPFKDHSVPLQQLQCWQSMHINLLTFVV